jgi:hypothetical protein
MLYCRERAVRFCLRSDDPSAVFKLVLSFPDYNRRMISSSESIRPDIKIREGGFPYEKATFNVFGAFAFMHHEPGTRRSP